MVDGKTDKILPIDDDLQSLNDVVPLALSPAGRLQLGATIVMDRTHKVKWDAERLKQLALAIVDEDRLAQRQLFDEALEYDWNDVQELMDLSHSEKVWRTAHELAIRGTPEAMAWILTELPASGYAARAGLILPFIRDSLEGYGDSPFLDLVESWDESLPFASALKTVLGRRNDHRKFIDAAEEIATLAPVEGYGSEILQSIASDRIPEPISNTNRLWRAYHAYDGDSAEIVAPEDLSVLPPTLVDDLIDAQRVDPSVDADMLPNAIRDSVLARVRPQDLSEDELRSVDHQDELARRFFLSRNSSALSGLDLDRQSVVHYRALSALRGGEDYDNEDLRPSERALLNDFIAAMDLIKAGETSFMPSDVLGDPTLWPALQDLALANKVEVTAEQRAELPRFADWIDLNTMIALLWKGDDSDVAYAVGPDLVKRLQDEAMLDEVLNLRAFSLWREGKPIEALACLEEAMEGEYTEALLVNTSIIASACEPATAAKYLGRLVSEAPSMELRVAALRRSVGLWQSVPDLKFPEATTAALRQVIGSDGLSDGDYYEFMNLASRVDAENLADHPPNRPGSATQRVTFDVFVTRAKAMEGKAPASNYSQTLIDVSASDGRPPWVETITNEWIDLLAGSLEEDFGEAMGVASAMDVFIMNGRDLLSLHTYLFSAPQCGAHFSWDAWNNGARLTDSAAIKFFYEPVERFAIEKNGLPERLAEIIGFNFHFCLVAYAIRELNYARMISAKSAPAYNDLNQRRQWDHQNRWNIQNRMGGILDADQEMIDVVKRILERADRFESDPNQPQRRKVQNDVAADLRSWQDEIIRLRATL